MKATRENIKSIEGKVVRWMAAAAKGNETYCGTARILKVNEERRPLEVEVIEGDNLGYAFFSEYDDELCLSDAGRYVEFCILDDSAVVYEVRDSEAGNVIETFATRQEAEAALEAYEKSDEEEGIYTPDYYEVHPRCLSEREMIGKRIAAIRNELCLSQQDVADRVGMAQPHIARIEAGRYSVGVDILGKITEALGKRIDIVD